VPLCLAVIEGGGANIFVRLIRFIVDEIDLDIGLELYFACPLPQSVAIQDRPQVLATLR